MRPDDTMAAVDAARALSITTRELLRRVDAGDLPIRRDVKGLPRVPVRAVEAARGRRR